MKKRYLTPHILRDLNEKMGFIGGARQVGKTSLAKYIAENYFKHYDYLNWDARDDRKNILQSQFKGNAEIVPFKEIVFQESGKETKEALEIALKFGGFPEPLLKQNEKELRRWHNQRVERLGREDIRDLENIRELSLLHVLVDILPDRVGSLLSLNSLREDLSVAHKTVAHWMDILERFYYHFRIYPFHHKKIRSLKKEPKLYLWDWSEVPDERGARLENIVASHLLKMCHFLNDVEGYKTDLHFLRDAEAREVDFLVTESGKPWFAVEVKSNSRE